MIRRQDRDTYHCATRERYIADADRGAAGGDTRKRRLKCYARRDFGPTGEGGRWCCGRIR